MNQGRGQVAAVVGLAIGHSRGPRVGSTPRLSLVHLSDWAGRAAYADRAAGPPARYLDPSSSILRPRSRRSALVRSGLSTHGSAVLLVAGHHIISRSGLQSPCPEWMAMSPVHMKSAQANIMCSASQIDTLYQTDNWAGKLRMNQMRLKHDNG